MRMLKIIRSNNTLVPVKVVAVDDSGYEIELKVTGEIIEDFIRKPGLGISSVGPRTLTITVLEYQFEYKS